MNNKKIIIIILAALGAVVLIAVIIFSLQRTQKKSANDNVPNVQSENFKADFLTLAEKQNLNIPADTRVQALKRNSQGDVMVYKIIRSDQDIANPSNVKPLSPRTN